MRNVAVLFPGQGAQEVGMGRDLIGRDPLVDFLLDIGSQEVGIDLARLALKGPARELSSTRSLQPLLCALCLGLYRRLESAGLRPSVFAGHSLGELPSLAACGFCDDETAVRLALLRGRLMDDLAKKRTGAMIAVSPIGYEQAQALLDEQRGAGLSVAAVNGPSQVSFSGDVTAIELISAHLRKCPGMQVAQLRVSGAWHSEHMRGAVVPLREATERAPLRIATFPMVFNRDGMARTEPADVPQTLAMQMVSPVRFDLVMAELMGRGITDYVEVGPGKVLRGLVRLSCTDPAVRVHNVTDLRSADRCIEELSR